MSQSTDEAGIRQAIRAVLADGWVLAVVDDGGEDIPVTTEDEAVEAITAVNEAALCVQRPPTPDRRGDYGHLFFVLGNGPGEVLCDYTINLTALDALLGDDW